MRAIRGSHVADAAAGRSRRLCGGDWRTHSVREFVEMAFGSVGLDYHKHVVIDPQLFRPAEVDLLVGDPAKAAARLGMEAED